MLSVRGYLDSRGEEDRVCENECIPIHFEREKDKEIILRNCSYSLTGKVFWVWESTHGFREKAKEKKKVVLVWECFFGFWEREQREIESNLIMRIYKWFYIYLPTPPLEQDMTQGQFFKRSLTGLNSEFSFP